MSGKKKVVTIVGARPQFIKAAAVSRILRDSFDEIIVHTGQHYDENMSDIFFKELHIPVPDVNLGVGSGSHAEQTGKMMIGIEAVLMNENPDYLLVYGDTNSTLAGAVAASKLHIPVVHVEAGLRSYNMKMPEEQNRVLTDHISSLLFCPTDTAVNNLGKEGIVKGVYQIGDVMCDAVLYYSKKLDSVDADEVFGKIKVLGRETFIRPERWYMATVHRAENTDSPEKLKEILSAFETLDEKVFFPVHPRTRAAALSLAEEYGFYNTVMIEPVGYLDMLYLVKNAKKVITDSGGLQKEAYILNTPCVTVREQTEWVETLNGNHNILSRPNCGDIADKVLNTKIDYKQKRHYYGTGDAAKKMTDILLSYGGN